MKLLTLNFLTCARKSCKSSPAAFPLHPREVELEQIEVDLNPLFIRNMLPRLDWEAMRAVTQEVRGGQISFIPLLLLLLPFRSAWSAERVLSFPVHRGPHVS
jgi:hypothetical protein